MTEMLVDPADPIRPRQRLRLTGDAALAAPTPQAATAAQRETIFDAREVSVFYGAKRAIANVNLRIHKNVVTAIAVPVTPSRCYSRPPCLLSDACSRSRSLLAVPFWAR